MRWLVEVSRSAALLVAVAIVAFSCAGESSHDATGEPEPWAVTAWGERYELFPEVDPLVDGAVSPAHTHVTILDGFAPLTAGTVAIVLRGNGAEQVFESTEAVRPGIFNVEVAPKGAGEYDLLFRIESQAGREEIAGGRVRVGAAQDPGGLVAAAQPQKAVVGAPISFLKEQQWRTPFATAWVKPGSLRQAARGLARVRAASGNEITVTASIDGVLRAKPWPHVGQEVRSGETLFELVPRVGETQSLAALEAALAAAETELATATASRARLEQLLAVEAASLREVEEARSRVATIEARRAAAKEDLDSARAVREGRGDSERNALRAPFAGTVAAVTASPGAAVTAGDALARLVSTDPLWLEIELRPEAASTLASHGVAGLVLLGGAEPERLAAGDLRVIAIAPEVDAAKGTVVALIEVARTPRLLIGSTLEVEVLMPVERSGIVVPIRSIVDDGGVSVVYLQVEGESFARQEVDVVERQGDVVLVEGLEPGQRLVTLGGDAIRRATLLSSGEVEGHVH